MTTLALPASTARRAAAFFTLLVLAVAILAAPVHAAAVEYVSSAVVIGNAPGSWPTGGQPLTVTSPYTVRTVWATNVRSGPSTGYGITRVVPAGTYLTCDAWVHGQSIWSPLDNAADARWYRIAGTGGATPPAPQPANAFRFPVGAADSLSYRVTQPYASYGVYMAGRYHNGTDIATPSWTPLYAPANGTVVTSGYYGGWGNVLVIRHASPVGTVYSLMAHLSQRNVGVGATVSKGQLIGYTGNTGNSTGPHLHFEMRNFAALGAGYTAAHPATLGYRDPIAFVQSY